MVELFRCKGQEWNDEVATRVDCFGKERKEQELTEDKVGLLKNVDMESNSLGTIMNVFPTLRKRIRDVRDKVKNE